MPTPHPNETYQIPDEGDTYDYILKELCAILSSPNAIKNSAKYDASNNRNDWVSFVVGYIGRASDRMPINDPEQFRDNMLKAAGLIINAVLQLDMENSSMKSRTKS